MTSSKPYLIRAIYEWIVDNSLTPYITVDTNTPHISIPKECAQEDQLTLDISNNAASNLLIGNEAIEFKARFGGISHSIYIPLEAVMIIFAQENDRGMAFAPEEFDEDFIDFDEDFDEFDEFNESNEDFIDKKPTKSANKSTLKLL